VPASEITTALPIAAQVAALSCLTASMSSTIDTSVPR
jgi:hypothetical protein